MESLKQAIPTPIKKSIYTCRTQLLSYLPLSLKLKMGLPLTIKQKREMIQRLINEHPVSKKGERILFWRGPSRGSIHVELMIALALKLRGFDIQFVICDGALSGCIQRGVDKEPLERWETQCPNCVRYGVDALESCGISYIGISELVSPIQCGKLREKTNNIPKNGLDSYEYHKIPVGMFAGSSTQRYLRGYSFKDHEEVLREYLYSALVCTEAARISLGKLKPTRIFMQQHDFYVAWAPASKVATNTGVPVTFWGGGMYEDGVIGLRPAKDTQFKSLHLMSNESWHQRSNISLTKREDEALDAYLDGFYHKTQTNTNLKSIDYPSREKLLMRLNITDNKPIWGIFAHVSWGEAANFEKAIHKDTVSWILNTIRIISGIEDITWFVKIHPAEMRGTIHGIENIIRENFPGIDCDRLIIPATSDISLQDLFPILSGGVTISSTVGLELALQGIPVILAGQAHYSDKGFTFDASTQEQYAELLHSANRLRQLSKEQIRLARQYAYSLFLQRRIPLNMGSGVYRFAPLDFRKLHLLLPGHDPAMDMICERIVDGGEFIL